MRYRVLLIGPFGEGFLADSYAAAFESIGLEVLKLDSDSAYLTAARYAGNRVLRRLGRRLLWNEMNRSTLRVVQDSKPDVVFVLKGAYLDPDTIERIRREHAVVVNYYPDNPYCGVPLLPFKTSAQRTDLLECLRQYSTVYTWSEQLAARLRADQVPASFLPFGVDRRFYAPGFRVPDNEDLAGRAVFVGQRNRKRDDHLSSISSHQLTIWGPLWRGASRRVRRAHVVRRQRVFGRLCAGVYGTAAVALNVVDDLNMPGHNMRTFEIPASGGVMLSTYTPEQADFFPEREAAFYYRTREELDDVLDRVLSDPVSCSRVRRTALRLSDQHTYEKRAQRIAADLALHR